MKILLKTFLITFVLGIHLPNYKIWAIREDNDKDTSVCFVANIITYVPNSFPKNLEDIETYKKYKRENFDYYISSKQAEKMFSGAKKPSSSRGEVLTRYITSQTAEGFNLTPFLTKIREEAFSCNKKESETQSSQYLKVAFLLNRMESLDKEYNQITYVAENIDETFYGVRDVLWRPCWKKRYMQNGVKAIGKGKKVEIEEVRQYYKKLLNKNHEKAQAFIYYNEHTFLNSSVPYNALRESLMKSGLTKQFVRDFHIQNPGQPVYLAFLDDDTLSFRTGEEGTLSCYKGFIRQFYEKQGDFPICLTSGYSISWNQHPCLSLGVSLDLAVRRAMAQTFSLAPYYPEPNTIVYIPPELLTLPESFRKQNESSPSEIPTLIKSIANERYNGSWMKAAQYCGFLPEGDVETTLPPRFFLQKTSQNIQKVEKSFSDLKKKFKITSEDLKNIRSIPQSHLWPKEWGIYIQSFLAEKQKQEIALGKLKISSSATQNRFVLSVLSNLYTYYSPVNILINRSECFDYHYFIGFLKKAKKNYNALLPLSVEWTYGTNYKKNKAAIEMGAYLRKNFRTLDQVILLLNSFYQPTHKSFPSYGQQIMTCVSECAAAELRTFTHYIQRYHTSSPSHFVKIKKEISPPASHPSSISPIILSHKKEKDGFTTNHTPDTFLNSVAEKYKQAMINADINKGEVLWGGDIELIALGNVYNLNIKVYGPKLTIPAVGPHNGQKVSLWLEGGHYQVYNLDTKQKVNVNFDGNCLFSCIYFIINNRFPNINEVEELRAIATAHIDDNQIYERFQAVLNAESYNSFNEATKDLPQGTLLEQAKQLSKIYNNVIPENKPQLPHFKVNLSKKSETLPTSFAKQQQSYTSSNAFDYVQPITALALKNKPKAYLNSISKKTQTLNDEEARNYLKDLTDQGKTLSEIALKLGYDPLKSTGKSALSKFLSGKTKSSPTIVNKLNKKIKEKGRLF